MTGNGGGREVGIEDEGVLRVRDRRRSSMKTVTQDCRLRIKTGLFLLTNGGKNESKEKLELLGACLEPGSSDPNCDQIYQNMLLPSKPQALVARLHDVLSMEHSSMWLELLLSLTFWMRK
jgi:hypothetical protein